MQSQDSDPVLIETRGSVGFLVLNQPERRNSLGAESAIQIHSALDELLGDGGIRALVITGAGSVFCSGGDLHEIMSPEPRDIEADFAMVRSFNRLIGRIRGLDLGVIAAVNGPAVGGGVALALACDFAIGTPTARYDFAFGRVGLSSADMGTAYMLTKAIGRPRASRLLLTGASIGVDELVQMGLITEIVSVEKLIERASEIATLVAKGSPWALAATKLSVRRSDSVDFESSLEYEAYVQTGMMASPDHKKSLRRLLDGMSGGQSSKEVGK